MEVYSPRKVPQTPHRNPVNNYGAGQTQIARCKPWNRDPSDEYGFLSEGRVRNLNRQQRIREKTSERHPTLSMTPVISKKYSSRADLGKFSCRQKSSSDNDLSHFGQNEAVGFKNRAGTLTRKDRVKIDRPIIPAPRPQLEHPQFDLSDDYLDMNGYLQKEDPGGYYVEMNNNFVKKEDVYECVADDVCSIKEAEVLPEDVMRKRLDMTDGHPIMRNHGRSKSYDIASARSGIYRCRPCTIVDIDINSDKRTYENFDGVENYIFQNTAQKNWTDRSRSDFESEHLQVLESDFLPTSGNAKQSSATESCSSSPMVKSFNDIIYENCCGSDIPKSEKYNSLTLSSLSVSTRNSSCMDSKSIQGEIDELTARLMRLKEMAKSTSSDSSSQCSTQNELPSDVLGKKLDVMNEELGVLKRMVSRQNSYISDKIPCQTTAQAKLSKVADLSQLVGPLTEEAIIQILKARFQSEKYFTSIGPSLLLLNPTNQKPFPKVLYGLPTAIPDIQNEIQHIVTQYIESGHSQAIILGGYSGSGKTYTSHLLLRQLYEVIGGGSVTDCFKHISAALTVIQSLGTASTVSNKHSSRVGYFLENQISDLSIIKTKINCYFLDQARVTDTPPGERNFHIFYQMLSGLTLEEKVKLHLDGYEPGDFAFLPPHILDHGDLNTSFTTWKTSLAELGIPFYDVMRVLSAAMLLGNVSFHQGDSAKSDPIPNTEAASVAALLGITGMKLYNALTVRTSIVGGQKVKAKLDPANIHKSRNSLAKALFTRTLAAIVKRANTMKRPSSGSTISTDSSDSMQLSGQDLLTSTPNKYPGTPGKSQSNHSGSGHGGNGFIGIVDMFGFEITQANRFEQLCINMCSEVLEHIYTTHLFRNPLDCQKDEGIELGIDFIDNTAVVEILSAKRTGLLSILNIETYQQSCPAEFLNQLDSVHGAKTNLFRTDNKNLTFTITHYGGKQTYNTHSFLDTNRDSLPDDIVCIFAKHNCNFGFVTHLFCGDLRNYSELSPKGMQHRVAPVPAPEPGSTGHEGKNTLAHDFSMKMDGLLKTLGHAKPHFIRCIKSSFDAEPNKFNRDDVVVQLRALQVLETVHLMAAGYPHRMRYRAFNSKYRFLAKGRRKMDDPVHEAKMILDFFLKTMDKSKHPYGSCSWSLGRKYIFLNEGARHQLELLRAELKDVAATRIQAFWKCWQCAKKWKILREKQKVSAPRNILEKLDSSPELNLIPKNDQLDHTDYMLLKKTCQFYGVKLDTPPPLPANRGYTVQGGIKMTFPQTRIMRQDYGEDGNLGCFLHKGQDVKVTGVKRGFVIVEHQGHTMYIPHQLTDTKVGK